MAFVNEFIPKTDMEKYNIKEIDQDVGITRRINSDSWTIDRINDMYLRCVARGREESRHESAWTFFWHGELLWVELEIIETSNKGRGVPGWSRKRLVKLCVMNGNNNHLPADLALHKEQILTDLKEALLAYKDGGVFAAATTYELTLEIAEGV